jgi:predicted RNA-binding Zn-ribbon protein involved in translation (DUF1610 family)
MSPDAKMVSVDSELLSLPKAKLSAARDGVQVWRCPNCGREIGAVIGDRVVLESGTRRLTCSVRENPVQTCFKCGQHSVLRLAS